jgi:hypothetical protein
MPGHSFGACGAARARGARVRRVRGEEISIVRAGWSRSDDVVISINDER